MRLRDMQIPLLAVVWALASTGAGGAEEPVKVSPELAEVLSLAQDDLQNDRPDEAVRRLEAFTGKDHALRQTLLGHAYRRGTDLPRAVTAYQRALAMDPELRAAGISLAEVYARQEDWPKAAELLGRHLDTDSCRADAMMLYAQVAQQNRDARLHRLLVRKGLVRFPGEARFRRLDLAALEDEGDYAQANQAAMDLLTATPADAGLWRHVAFTCERMGRDADCLSALEADLLCDPSDLDRHRRFLSGLLATGDWLTAVRHGQALLAGPLAKTAAAAADVMDLLIQAADAGAKDGLLATWLALVPEGKRTRAMRIVAARRALRDGKTAQAREALGKLISAGETDASIFLWAGQLAEAAADRPAAKTLYEQARSRKGSGARLAGLYLARLHVANKEYEPARRLLEKHLNDHPEDAAARAMLSLARAAGPPPK